ncbi:ATP-binding protein [Streptomyces prunicolor]
MTERRREAMPATHAAQVGPPPVLLLKGEAKSAKFARDFVRQYVKHNFPDASEDHVETVVLVACELVTNSIRYGTRPGDSLRIELDTDDTRTRVEVHDPVRRRPHPRPASDRRDRGRGLIILDALCPGSWGVRDRPFGKFVWAEVKAS